MKKVREVGKVSHHLDETWVNMGQSHTKEWLDSKDKGRTKKDLTSKGSRLIAVDIGSRDGFVEGSLLVFQSKSTKDHHEQMDGERYTPTLGGRGCYPYIGLQATVRKLII